MSNKITILVDNDSWIIPFANILINELSKIGYTVALARNHHEVSFGWINFMLGCIKITPNEILERNQHNLVVHESDLPKGKGFSPMSWLILDGINEIPVCLLEASSDVDAGDIWIRDTIKLSGSELHHEWRKLQGEKTIELCLRAVKDYQTIKPEKQSGKSSFYKKRYPADSELNIKKSIEQQFNLLRIVDNENYPLFFKYNGIKYTLSVVKKEIITS